VKKHTEENEEIFFFEKIAINLKCNLAVVSENYNL